MFTILIFDHAFEAPQDVQTFETLERATKVAKFEVKWCAWVQVHDPEGCCIAIHEGEDIY